MHNVQLLGGNRQFVNINANGVCLGDECLKNLCHIKYSRTPDLDFSCFYPCDILSHIPVPAPGKDEKRTAARRPQATRTSTIVVILTLE